MVDFAKHNRPKSFRQFVFECYKKSVAMKAQSKTPAIGVDGQTYMLGLPVFIKPAEPRETEGET